MSQINEISTPLRPVEWLAAFLGVSEWSAYEAIKNHHIPAECVVRLGRRIRVNERLIRAWADNKLETAAG